MWPEGIICFTTFNIPAESDVSVFCTSFLFEVSTIVGEEHRQEVVNKPMTMSVHISNEKNQNNASLHMPGAVFMVLLCE